MSLNKFTNRGSNIDPDDDRSQAVDRERDAVEFNESVEATNSASHKEIERLKNLLRECEAEEISGGGLAFLEKSERELIKLLLDFFHDGHCNCEGYYRANPELYTPCSSCKIHEALCDVPESTFNKLRESIK